MGPRRDFPQQVIAKKYLPSMSVLAEKYKAGDFYVWKSIVKVKDALVGGFGVYMGEGLTFVQ